ncbi:GGDEF domain-containing phosphodiesterase [Sphingomonas solaris]|uniref:EAL domain-containing protein n=1 Tax=Alterirhizorhabdus solaris TaxID=2529389 RepID=A0A558QWZ9_9SPHN|nr:EAL domain-containing protein [Sphingomonas solaris]TVV71696.1 EAL domain-containing protein [Sphingomonas solaris]
MPAPGNAGAAASTPGRRVPGRYRRGLTLAGAVAFAVILAVSGLGDGAEHTLASLRMAVGQVPASGRVAIVEIDAESLRALPRWPWPRRYYAAAVDRLAAAGAEAIAFDVDVSAASTAADDRIFATALHAAGGAVILPTFRQAGSHDSGRWIDSLPLPAFRRSSFLAAVNIFPDPDGAVRAYPRGVRIDGSARPSIAVMLVGGGGGDQRSFPIDYAIDPDTIPRISFIDLVSGRIDPATLRGKRVLIGATAIELGDRYAVPRHGIVPGVLIQALAAETLMRHGVPVSPGAVPAMLLALLVLIATSNRGRRMRAIVWVAAIVGLIAGAGMLHARGIDVEIVPALGLLLAAAAGRFAFTLLDELEQRRFVDRESGLPNRAALERAAPAYPDTVVTIARLDRFNEIAAALGGPGGAHIIAEIAGRIVRVLETPVYRIEPGVIGWLARPLDGDDAQHGHFAGLLAVIGQTLEVAGTRIDIRPTFGVAQPSDGAIDAQVAGALMAAQRARAKAAPWGRFMADDGQQERRQMALLGEFSEALASGAIWVAYQPKFGLAENRVIGAEALVRWRHPERGPIPPDDFIPLIETEGRARELTCHVLDHALADLSAWLPGRPDLVVAVNLSAMLLQEAGLKDLVGDALARHGVPPANLTLELTESAIIANAADAACRLAELRELGVKLSIDDYGTGQSTLSYLRQVPASELKIDKCFVRCIVDNPHDRLLVRSTIDLAHALDMTVVAEGVEDAACLDALRLIGCDVIQGWHTGKPMPADEFAATIGCTSSRLAA